METSQIELITKSLLKSLGKVVSNKEIESLQKLILGSGFNENKFYKLIYALKNKGYLIELKNGLYVVSYPEAHKRNSDDIKASYYWQVLFTMLKQEHKIYYIGGRKGLEIHLGDYEIPEEIEVIIGEGSGKKQTVLTGLHLNVKSVSYQHPRKTAKQIAKIIQTKSQKISINGKSFIVGPIEACLLEMLYYSTKSNSGYEIELAKKSLKRYKSKLDFELIKILIQAGKYHTSLNRLYELCKHIDSTLAGQFFSLIKSDSFRIAV